MFGLVSFILHDGNPSVIPGFHREWFWLGQHSHGWCSCCMSYHYDEAEAHFQVSESFPDGDGLQAVGEGSTEGLAGVLPWHQQLVRDAQHIQNLSREPNIIGCARFENVITEWLCCLYEVLYQKLVLLNVRGNPHQTTVFKALTKSSIRRGDIVKFKSLYYSSNSKQAKMQQVMWGLFEFTV